MTRPKADTCTVDAKLACRTQKWEQVRLKIQGHKVKVKKLAKKGKIKNKKISLTVIELIYAFTVQPRVQTVPDELLPLLWLDLGRRLLFKKPFFSEQVGELEYLSLFLRNWNNCLMCLTIRKVFFAVSQGWRIAILVSDCLPFGVLYSSQIKSAPLIAE